MLTLRLTTAKRLLPAILLAVFFSPICQAQETVTNSLNTFETDLGELIYRLSHSVVTVEAARRVSGSSIAGAEDGVLETVVSSGLIVDTLGHIVVSAPLVVGKDRITVSYRNRMQTARLVATDYQAEIALLHCSFPDAVPVDFSLHQACAGQVVVAIGNSFGVRSSPTLGFCAGVRSDGTMQFSMPVASGTIGGGVFDLSGRLLAVIRGGLGDDTQVTTAVPAYRVAASVDYLKRHGDRPCGFVGITTRDIEIYPGLRIQPSAQLASAEPYEGLLIERGVLITMVLRDSPADDAGLREGDLVFAVDQMYVNSAAGLAAMAQQSAPGRVLHIDLIRENEPLSLNLKVGAKTAAAWEPQYPKAVASDVRQVVDSLKAVLEQVQGEIRRLEGHLDRL